MTVPVQPPLSLVAERVRRRRMTFLHIGIAVLVVIAVSLLTLWLFLWSNVLDVERLEVSGTVQLSAEHVVEPVTGVVGEPLLSVNLSQIESQVAAVAAVADVQAKRKWPNSVVLVVRERQPLGVVTANGQDMLVDASGVVFVFPGSEPAGTRIVPSVDVADGQLSSACVRVLAALPAQVLADVVQVDAVSVNSVKLLMTKDREVVWGGADRSDRKAEVLSALLLQRASVYDVSAPEMPVIRNTK